MPAAASGKFTLIGSPHWTSGPLAIIPVDLHKKWGAELTESDSIAMGRMSERVVTSETQGVFFPLLGEAGLFQQGSMVTLVDAVDLDGRRPVFPKLVLEAAAQVEVEDNAWKLVDHKTFNGPHVMWNAWAKNLQGEAIRERQGGLALHLGAEDYVIEEIRGVPFAVKPMPNKKPIQVKYNFTRLRPANVVPVAVKPAKAALPPIVSVLVAAPDTIKAGKKLEFVDSDQTCIVVLPRAALPSWGGVDGKSTENADYDRACAVSGAGLIPVAGKRKALVIGMDSPMAFHPTKTGGLILIWVGADSATGVLALALSIPDKQWKKTKLTWDVGDGKLVMIGALSVGRKAGRQRVDIALASGKYRVEECWGFAGDVRVGKKTEEVGISALRLVRM